jgi:HPt (histidine-containing phosphotransfer) domain-containing protein
VNQCYGQLEVFQKMVEYFLADADSISEQMRAALNQGAGTTIAELAHKLVNTVFYLGCPSATTLLRRLEHAGKAQDLAGAAMAMCQLEPQLEALKEALAPHRKKV